MNRKLTDQMDSLQRISREIETLVNKLLDERKLKVGSLVQLNPQTVGNPAFAGCIMIVTEIKAFGVQGYVQALGTRQAPGRLAYYRAGWHEFEVVGLASWMASQD